MEILRRETDYAMRALVRLTEEEAGELVSTRRLSEDCGISLDHVRKIMPKLARAGLVKPVRGATGGFCLTKAPGEVRLKEVVDAIQGPLSVNKCALGVENCCRSTGCPMVGPVRYMQERLDQMTQTMTLEDLARGNVEKAKEAIYD